MKRHELDELLSGLTPAEEALPENRVRVTAACFQNEVNRCVALPPTEEQRPEIADWLRDGLNDGRLMGRRPPITRTRLAVYPTWIDKARSLQGRLCDVCSTWAGPGMPVSFDVPMEPFSAQCSPGDLRRYKEEISSYMGADRMTAQGWRHQPVCITVVAVVSQKTRIKDADNLVKGFIDSLQNVLFENDRAIQHLEVFRFQPKIPAGGYLVTARPVRALEDDVMDQSRGIEWRRRIPSARR